MLTNTPPYASLAFGVDNALRNRESPLQHIAPYELQTIAKDYLALMQDCWKGWARKRPRAGGVAGRIKLFLASEDVAESSDSD